MRLITLVAIVLLTNMFGIKSQSAEAEKAGSLYGTVLFIDSGHGGRDSGATAYIRGPDGKKVQVTEAEYVYDVACRLRAKAKARGAIVVMSTWDRARGCRLHSGSPRDIIPSDSSEVFVSTRKTARSNTKGLFTRTNHVNSVLKRYKNHRVVFVSIHFDATGNSGLQGVSFVSPSDPNPEIVDYLVEEFRKKGRLRKLNGAEYTPVKVSGDPASGMRRLHVLSNRANNVRQKVLVELGNFTNRHDLWRIRDEEVRDEYAEAIIRALERVNQLPVSKTRG